jgi:two-component system, cell cycle response regulator CtrA
VRVTLPRPALDINTKLMKEETPNRPDHQRLLADFERTLKDKVRFAIGRPGALHSGVWAYWGNKDDFYVGARSILGSTKISLHRSRKCRLALTERHFLALAQRGLSAPSDRAFVKWERPAAPEEGIDLSKVYDYDIILLDLNLPDMSGFEVLRSLRAAKVQTPTLILSGHAGVEDKIKGFGFGADDYMTKPFHKDELVARIHAIVRRSRGHAQSVIEIDDLVVNLDTRTTAINGTPVHLTPKEYQMLELLSLRKGMTMSKEMFLNHLYGGMDEPSQKIIDVFMCKLRKKLANASGGKDYIETVWGRGYVLRQPTDEEPAKISA